MDLDMTRSARFLLPMIRKALARLPGALSQQKTVAVDLTPLHYPQFLEPEELSAGDRDFHETLRIADNLVCFSHHARGEILDASRVTAARVTALPSQPLRRLPHPPHDTIVETLDRLGLV